MDYCGESIMWKIWEHYAGGHLYVPLAQNLNPEHPLVQRLGVKDAMTFCQAFGGEYLADIPKATAAKRKLRNKAIAADSAHMSTMALGRKYDLTERAIYMILAEEKSEIKHPNYDLFDDAK